LSGCLAEDPDPTCPNDTCPNHAVGVSESRAYQSFGTTCAGAKRYRCCVCKRTFSVNRAPATRQRLDDRNADIFNLLVNKVPFRRICEVAQVSMDTLYRKIAFIHRQCLSFAGSREQLLPEMNFPRLYLSVDRQDHVVNWSRANDKRNITLSAIGSADNATGFVFGVHVNYDPSMNPGDVAADARRCGDDQVSPPFRRYARLWLDEDYAEALVANERRRNTRHRRSLSEDIQTQYQQSLGREDIEAPENVTASQSLPRQGMLVHAEYTLYAHFLLLHHLLKNVGKIRFYLDQESGIRAACLAAFANEVQEKRCDAFFVRINKDLTINEKRRLKAQGNRALAEFRDSNPVYAELSDFNLRLILIQQRMKGLVDIGPWQDRWLFYPFPDMSEPEKAICWLTDLRDHSYSDDHLARLFARATLHGIDRFFMQVRRRISLLERPIGSASSEGRKWHGYSAYNPEMVGKMLDIFRVFYNYVEIGQDKRTPAMRLGLAADPSSLSDILQHRKSPPVVSRGLFQFQASTD
jgi:transposase-like protein